MSHFDYDALRFGESNTGALSTSHWDALVDQIEQLENTINRIHLGEPGSEFAGRVGIGTSTPEGQLQIINKAQDAEGNTLILGPTNAPNLRLGYHNNYSWVQSHGSKPLAINPRGNNVGIGVAKPESTLHVNGRIESSKDGFKFPDGSVQISASQATRVQSGKEVMNRGSWSDSPLAKGKTHTSGIIPLNGFSHTPHILHSICRFDCERRANTRISIRAISLSKKGFKLKFETWSDSAVYHCDVNWIAIGV